MPALWCWLDWVMIVVKMSGRKQAPHKVSNWPVSIMAKDELKLIEWTIKNKIMRSGDYYPDICVRFSF